MGVEKFYSISLPSSNPPWDTLHRWARWEFQLMTGLENPRPCNLGLVETPLFMTSSRLRHFLSLTNLVPPLSLRVSSVTRFPRAFNATQWVPSPVQFVTWSLSQLGSRGGQKRIKEEPHELSYPKVDIDLHPYLHPNPHLLSPIMFF